MRGCQCSEITQHRSLCIFLIFLPVAAARNDGPRFKNLKWATHSTKNMHTNTAGSGSVGRCWGCSGTEMEKNHSHACRYLQQSHTVNRFYVSKYFFIGCWWTCTPAFCLHLDWLTYSLHSAVLEAYQIKNDWFLPKMSPKTVHRTRKFIWGPLNSFFESFQLQPSVFISFISCH